MREILLAVYQAGVDGMSISEAIEIAGNKLTEEIEKELLTDEEIENIRGARYSPAMDAEDYFMAAFNAIAQAQLQKIIKKLEEK
jgi:hypothetical protein